MSITVVNKNALDVSQIFQTYLTFFGDADRTAIALNLDPVVVRDLARSENWSAKISEMDKLRDGDAKDFQIQLNRAVNYVQAHRLRSIFDRLITVLAEKSGEEMITLLSKSTRGSVEFSTRPLADLAKAVEACQAMTQRALGDTAAERPEDPGNQRGSRMALLVMNAMDAADKLGGDSVSVVREQLQAPPKLAAP